MNVADLVVANYDWLRVKARKLCYNEGDVEDLVADTILRILESCSHFDSQRDFRPWAQAVMYNWRFTQLSRKKRVQFLPIADYDAPTSITPDDEMQGAIVRGIIEQLAKQYDSVRCVQLYIDGYTVSEMADMMGVSAATIRSRMFAGRKRIRNTLTHFDKC